MCSSIDTFELIFSAYENELSVEKTLKNHEKYYAHTPARDSNKKAELLAEHLSLVNSYFIELTKAHGLEKLINRLILDYLSDVGINSLSLAQYIKVLFAHSIFYHDHGKINENFQASPIKMNNPNFRRMENSDNALGTHHSALSSYIFLCHKIEEAFKLFKGKERNLAISLVVLFSYTIYKHHSKYFQNDFLTKIITEGRLAKKLKPYLNQFYISCQADRINCSLLKLEKVLPRISFNSYARSFPLYQMLRLNFSLLTASDYLATNEYMNDDRTTDFGILTKKRIQKIYKKVSKEEWIDVEKTKINFNKNTYDELQRLSWKKPTIKSFDNLNLLRQQMATEAILTVRKNLKHNIFYLEAPTGGGKTNISMLVTLELLKTTSGLKKVFYVFPFTTLIDQTYKSIRQHFGLEESEIIALHSKSSFLKDNKKDDLYGKYWQNYIDYLFVHYPFCLLSHIRFFEILKTNEKERNYNLHRLANSVVVLDELQTYPPEHWDKIIYFIQKYAKYYNIRFIIMSATLPKIGKLNVSLDTQNVIYLLSDARKDYFQNVNFKCRISFDFSLGDKKIDLEVLAQKVLEESLLYSKRDGGITKPKNSVYTIIEFIFKKTATLFYQIIKKLGNNFFDELFVISGTILEHRRKHIINFLKRKENRNKRILVVTTQVIEAGVDIDMDLGFKDTSLLDSDEQLAGRINRNANKEGCKLFLFNYNKEAIIYGKDLRYVMTQKHLTIAERKEILTNKNFDLLYDKVIAYKDKRNKDEHFVGFKDYKNHINALRFESISREFKLIDQENLSCFIPLNIPIKIDGEQSGFRENIFSLAELDFLKKNGIMPSENNKIKGQEVFDLYISFTQAKDRFHEKKLRIKQLQPILSKFVFSLYANPKMISRIVHFADIPRSEYGYYYMIRWNDFYDEELGIDEKKFSGIEETQFL